jgi:hypothetical protein
MSTNKYTFVYLLETAENCSSQREMRESGKKETKMQTRLFGNLMFMI